MFVNWHFMVAILYRNEVHSEDSLVFLSFAHRNLKQTSIQNAKTLSAIVKKPSSLRNTHLEDNTDKTD